MNVVGDMLRGIGNRLVQRLIVIAVLAVVLRGIGFFGSASDDGTFRSESRSVQPAALVDLPEEDEGWGSSAKAGGSSSSALARARAAEAERRRLKGYEGRTSHNGIPTYDPAEDGGWGSN